MSLGNEERRPRPESGAQMSNDPDAVIVRRADVALRCAWLRVVADEMYEVDTSGLLSAQLRDFADLLELTDEPEAA
ncbi:hypothetical protein ABT304_05790 [Nocardioides sp. NPDC000445]|uniref:hypothetical protein n=1 Tax=Nocardioides sp. NPDC000445 TaxID=3154257 RepID=UPI0033176F0E